MQVMDKMNEPKKLDDCFRLATGEWKKSKSEDELTTWRSQLI